jgi:glycosyltransferase involved in cell wall biosynthesis
MKVLLPISLDRWRNPISTLLRACVQYNPDIEFHSFSNPETDEDRVMGDSLWTLPNLRRRHPSCIFFDCFDLVHTASYSNGNYKAAVLAKLRGFGRTKFLNTLNIELDLSTKVDRSRYNKFIRVVDRFVAVSEAVARDVRNQYPERFLGVIPNGFDASLYDKEKLKCETKPDIVLKIGSGYPLWMAKIESRKNPQIFIDLALQNPGVPFVAMGAVDPSDGDIYAKQFKSVKNIHWLGSLERRTALSVLSNAGVLIFPSEREGLSLAMIEALAMEVPILAQPKSSMPELVFPGVNGELISDENIDLWNLALHKWLPSNRSYSQIQNLVESRDQVVKKYSWNVIGKQYSAIYQAMNLVDSEYYLK